jgi:hypothetical protein
MPDRDQARRLERKEGSTNPGPSPDPWAEPYVVEQSIGERIEVLWLTCRYAFDGDPVAMVRAITAEPRVHERDGSSEVGEGLEDAVRPDAAVIADYLGSLTGRDFEDIFASREAERGPDGERFVFNPTGPPWWTLEDPPHA